MRWVVDRIEDHLVILENISTKEKREIDIKVLSFSVSEGTVLIFQNGTYQMDNDFEEKRRIEIKKRFQNLRQIR